MPYHDDTPQCRIRVHLRLRPSAKPSTAIHIQDETATVLIDVQKSSGGGPPKSYMDQIVFNVDSIVQSTDQQQVYEQIAKPSVDDFLKGYNSTIMAYGQVGAGKTFTMTGDMKVTPGVLLTVTTIEIFVQTEYFNDIGEDQEV